MERQGAVRTSGDKILLHGPGQADPTLIVSPPRQRGPAYQLDLLAGGVGAPSVGGGDLPNTLTILHPGGARTLLGPPRGPWAVGREERQPSCGLASGVSWFHPPKHVSRSARRRQLLEREDCLPHPV